MKGQSLFSLMRIVVTLLRDRNVECANDTRWTFRMSPSYYGVWVSDEKCHQRLTNVPLS